MITFNINKSCFTVGGKLSICVSQINGKSQPATQPASQPSGRKEIGSWGGEKMDGGGRLSLSGPARFGPVRVGSAPKVSIWCRRDGTFSKWVAFAVGETTLDFGECAFGETLGGKC